MEPKVRSLYNSALKNKEFLNDVKEADNDKAPTVFSSSIEKHIFTASYYGWLVGKYGNDWKLFL